MPTARLPHHISEMPTIDRHTFREDVRMDRRRATALSCRVASPRAPLHLPRQVVRDSASALNDRERHNFYTLGTGLTSQFFVCKFR